MTRNLSRRDVVRLGASLCCLGPATRWTLFEEVSDDEVRVLAAARELARGGRRELRLLIPEGCQANLVENIGRFEALTDVRILIESVPVDEVSLHLTLDAAAGDNRFDIALPATFRLPDLVESEVLLALDELATEYEPDTLSSGFLYRHGDRYKGRFYGYQADGDVYVAFYNRRMLEDEALGRDFERRFGRPLETPRTWAELDSALEFFHAPNRGRFGGALFRNVEYSAWEWWTRFHAKGLAPFDADFRPQIDVDEGVVALEEMIGASKYLTKGARTHTLFENWDDFATGNVFCDVGWGGTQKYLRQRIDGGDEALLHAALPGGQRGAEVCPIPYFNWGWNYVVAKHSAEPELAYLFTLFCSLPAPSTRAVAARDGFFDPHREEHYADAAVRETYGDAFLEVHADSMRRALPDLYVERGTEYFDLLRRLVVRADRGEVTPRDALHAVSYGWEKLTEEIGRERQIERWGELRAAYPTEISGFLG